MFIFLSFETLLLVYVPLFFHVGGVDSSKVYILNESNRNCRASNFNSFHVRTLFYLLQYSLGRAHNFLPTHLHSQSAIIDIFPSVSVKILQCEPWMINLILVRKIFSSSLFYPRPVLSPTHSMSKWLILRSSTFSEDNRSNVHNAKGFDILANEEKRNNFNHWKWFENSPLSMKNGTRRGCRKWWNIFFASAIPLV